MSEKPDISANLELNISDYSRNIQRATRQADDVDKALDDIVDAANRAEKALNDLSGDIDVKLDTDFSSLLDADKTLQRLDTTITPLVDVQVANDTSVRALLEDFNGTLSPKINVEDSELKDAQQLLDRLDGETVTAKVNADDSDLAGVEEKLNQLRNLAVIDLVMNVADLPEQIPLLGAILDQDKASRIVRAGTGGDEALAGQYATGAEDVFADNFGADRQEAARAYMSVVQTTKDETGKLAKTGEDFGTITELAFTTATNTGEDFNAMLAAADKLVSTGLAPNFESAFDLINTGFQEGLNLNGDFFDTITEYSSQFADLGFDAEQFFSVLRGGLDAGAYNTDFIGDLFKEINIRAQAASAGEGVEFDAFAALGLTDEVKAFNAGEITGAEFASGLIQAVDKHVAEGGDLQAVFDALGTKAEDLTIEAVIQLDPAQVKEEFAQYDGTTVEVSAEIFGDIGSSVATLQRTIESELATSVSNAFDIPGKIQQLSDGVSKFSTQLDLGRSIPEAIEIAFQIPGFAETVGNLESALGNLTISVLEAAANILEGIGQGDAAAGIRGAVTQFAPGQLAFDLQFADTEEDVRAAITRGVNRGLEASDIEKTLVSTGQDMLESGDLEGTREYLTLLENIATTQAEIQFGGGGILSGLGGVPLPDVEAMKTQGTAQTAAQSALPALDSELVAAESAIETSLENMRMSAESKLPGMAEVATSSLAPVNAQVVDLSQAFDAADIAFTTMSTNTGTNAAAMSSTLSGTTNDVNSFANNATLQFTETVPVAVDTANLKMTEFGETVLNTMLEAGENVQGLIDKLLSIGTLDITMPGIGTGGGGGQIPGEAHGGLIPAGEIHRVHAGEMLVGGQQDLSVLNRQTSSVIENALVGLVGGGGGGGGNVTNNYVTVNNVFNNNGAAASTASMDAAKIRGF